MSTQDAERLRAGLTEDWRAAEGLAFACRIPDRVPDFTAAGGPAAEQFWARFTAHRELAGIAAKRHILALYEEQAGYDLPEGVNEGRDPDERACDQAIKDVLADVVAALAAVYQDAPAETPT